MTASRQGCDAEADRGRNRKPMCSKPIGHIDSRPIFSRGLTMPPYLTARLDPAEAAHRPPRQPRLQRRGHLLRGSRHHRRLRPGVQHRLPPAAADARHARSSRPAASQVEVVDAAGRCGTITSRPASMPRQRRPGHRPRAAVRQRRRDHVALPAGRAAGGALPQRRRRRGPLRPPAAAARCTPCSACCRSSRSTTSSSRDCTTYRLEFDAGHASPTCSSSRRPATSASRRAT